jgi:hypothetical protein
MNCQIEIIDEEIDLTNLFPRPDKTTAFLSAAAGPKPPGRLRFRTVVFHSFHITLLTHTELVELEGDNHLERVTWRNNQTNKTKNKSIAHVFVMTGADPNTDWLGGCVVLDGKGFIKTVPI